MFAASFFVPESPRFLVYKDRSDEALAVLEKMHHDPNQPDDDFYLREFHQIKAQIQLEREQTLGLSAILSKPSYRKRFLLVLGYAVSCM
jgi:hypothetical protein